MDIFKKMVCCLLILGHQQQLICQNSWWNSLTSPFTSPFKIAYEWATRNTQNSVIATSAIACIVAGCYVYQKYQAQQRLQNANAIKAFTQRKLWQQYKELLNIDYGLNHSGAELKVDPTAETTFFANKNNSLQTLQEHINKLKNTLHTKFTDIGHPVKTGNDESITKFRSAYYAWQLDLLCSK